MLLNQYAKIAFKVVDIVLAILWPFVVLYLVYQDKVQLMGFILLGYFIVRYLILSRTLQKNKQLGLMLSVTGIVLCGLSALFKNYHALLYYPVVVNITLLGVFGYSLYRPPTMIERFARLQQPDLTPFGQRYTFRVTQIWCLFFIINGSIALFSVLWGDMVLWAWWNGFISYLLIGCLLVGEWLIRKRVQRLDPQYAEYKNKS